MTIVKGGGNSDAGVGKTEVVGLVGRFLNYQQVRQHWQVAGSAG